MNLLVDKLKKNSFAKSVLLLVSGTGFAHLLTFLALPLLTRFYSPEQFSQLGVFVALVTIIASAACLRFEIAIPLPKLTKNALALLKLSLFIAATICFLLFTLLALFLDEIKRLIVLDDIALFLVPLAVFGLATYNALQFWFTRNKAFSDIAKTKVSQSVASNLVQLIGGAFSFPLGLIIGQMFNYFAGIFTMSFKLLKGYGRSLLVINNVRMLFNFKQFKHYPKYSTPEVLANNAGIHLPIILIASFLVGPEAGYLFLAIKVMQIPMMLMGASISQVYFSEVANKNDEEIKAITEKTLIALISFGVAPLVFIGAISSNAFTIAFGAEWKRAGDIVFLLMPWFIFQFLASPISMIMHVKQKQKSMLTLTLVGMLLRVGSILLIYFIHMEFFSEALAVSSALFYLICIFVFSSQAGVSWFSVASKLKNAVVFICLALVGSFITNLALENLF